MLNFFKEYIKNLIYIREVISKDLIERNKHQMIRLHAITGGLLLTIFFVITIIQFWGAIHWPMTIITYIKLAIAMIGISIIQRLSVKYFEKKNYYKYLEYSYSVFFLLYLFWGQSYIIQEIQIIGNANLYLFVMLLVTNSYTMYPPFHILTLIISTLGLMFALRINNVSDVVMLDITLDTIIFSLYAIIHNIYVYRLIYREKLSNDKIIQLAIEFEKLSQIDELTGLKNRRTLRTNFDEIANVSPVTLGIIIIDVDYFKRYNDTYGHIKGDVVLQMVGTLLASYTQTPSMKTYRYGGEEFLVTCELQSIDQLEQIAIKIHRDVNALKILHEQSETSNYISVSIGCYYASEFFNDNVSKNLSYADKALYAAKSNGRNCIYRYVDSQHIIRVTL